MLVENAMPHSYASHDSLKQQKQHLVVHFRTTGLGGIILLLILLDGQENRSRFFIEGWTLNQFAVNKSFH